MLLLVSNYFWNQKWCSVVCRAWHWIKEGININFSVFWYFVEIISWNSLFDEWILFWMSFIQGISRQDILAMYDVLEFNNTIWSNKSSIKQHSEIATQKPNCKSNSLIKTIVVCLECSRKRIFPESIILHKTTIFSTPAIISYTFWGKELNRN